ncbi:MAG: DUF5723 family protein [Clostridium sp.]|nr:DUF5723 family protein [Clostridium sp.]
MKRITSYIWGAALSATALVPVAAQNALRSSYFLEGSYYRHQLNPAFAPERNYFSFPVLGNMNVGLQGTVGVSDFIHRTPDGQLTTFMNKSVDAGDFLDGLKERNRINALLDLTIFSAGFRAFGGYNTVDLGFRSATRLNLPKDLFAFMKEGMSSANTVYEFDNLAMSTTNYVELALGHSHRINEDWTVGGKLKLLFGLAKADMKINRMKMVLSEDKWSIEGDGEMNAAICGLSIPSKSEAGTSYDTPDEADEIDWDNIEFDTPGLGGFGLALDLGATWKVRDDLEVSAAILDFGFMNWKNNIRARMGMEPWSFDGFHDIAVNPDEGDTGRDLEDQLEDLGDDLENCMNFRKDGQGGSRSAMLGATLNLGALYTLPYYDRLKFGFLSSTRINGPYSWSEGRFSANIAPVKCFDASINYAVSSFGSSLGWLLNVHTRGFNFFIGSDHQFFKVTPQFIPVHHLNTNFSMGINFPLGARKAL